MLYISTPKQPDNLVLGAALIGINNIDSEGFYLHEEGVPPYQTLVVRAFPQIPMLSETGRRPVIPFGGVISEYVDFTYELFVRIGAIIWDVHPILLPEEALIELADLNHLSIVFGINYSFKRPERDQIIGLVGEMMASRRASSRDTLFPSHASEADVDFDLDLFEVRVSMMLPTAFGRQLRMEMDAKLPGYICRVDNRVIVEFS